MSSIGKVARRKFSAALLTVAAISILSSSAFGQATIIIQVNDTGATGFNDPTAVNPVGGNPGTTLGQQRLNAVQYAANIWGATLVSSSTITVLARWDDTMPCSANSATLAAAGAVSRWSGFSGGLENTWYGAALANALTGVDLRTTGTNPGPEEITARFNPDLGNSDCLNGAPYYLGFDANHGSGVDLVAVALHELSHGLGFQTFTSSSTGTWIGGVPSIYDRFLFDSATGKTWSDAGMTDAERQASAISTDKLAWKGAIVTSHVRDVQPSTPLLKVNSPAAIAGNYRFGTAAFGPALSSPGVTANVAQSAPAEGCSALTNSSEISGKIALIDRGPIGSPCNFDVKVKNAQNAGAVGVIVADHTAGPVAGMAGSDPTITIPSVRITLADGNTIKGQAGVNASLLLDFTVSAGADAAGRALMFTPNPVEIGSSVSHWDSTAFPNQLMEPNIAGDLKHFVTPPYDLTTSLLRDLGWTTVNPIGRAEFFTQVQYRDFLSRYPDADGLAFWANQIISCGNDSGCIVVKRTNVSAAFYLSIEFQETGYLVYRFYKAGYGNLDNGAAPVPVRFNELLPDTQQIGNGVVVGVGNWQTQLENNKVAFAQSFVTRVSFVTKHPTSLSPEAFVNALFANAGVTPTASEQSAAVTEFGGAGNTANTAARGRALRLVAENPTLRNLEFNKAFVLMQYFGYLRRSPNDLPDSNYDGYNFWLNKLVNENNGDYIKAEMVKAFIESIEYGQRFGP